jgi:hypothetical protein
MSQEISTRRGVLVHQENPFMVEVKTKTRRVTSRRGDMMLISSETGEIQTTVAGFWEAEEVDATKFVKLFVNGIKALAELSNAGTKVFEVLCGEMRKNIGRDQIYMGFAALDQNVTKISRATFKRGMAELIDKEFIAATPMQGVYWLNPDFVWNGDRLAFVKEYRKKKFDDLVKVVKQTTDRDERTVDMFPESQE